MAELKYLKIKKYNITTFFIIILLFLNSLILTVQGSVITNEEDRSEYFRNEIISNLSRQQILNYLTRKETAENSEAKDLAARYIYNLLQPYDRKLDDSIADNWSRLAGADKDSYRFEWFKQNKNSISTKEIQKYIIIDDLVVRARDAMQQLVKREKRETVDFNNLYSEPEFFSYVDKASKQVDVAPPKPEPIVSEPKRQTAGRRATQRKPAPEKQVSQRSKKSTEKTARSSTASKQSTAKSSAYDLVKGAKTREISEPSNTQLNVQPLRKAEEIIQPSAPHIKQPEGQVMDERIRQLQMRVNTLKHQVQQNIREIDSLKNFEQ